MRRQVAALEVCHDDCSPVLHKICGVIHTLIEPVPAPQPRTQTFNVDFRIVDEFGREVCQQQVSYAFTITPPDIAVTDIPSVINLPFCIKCCDRNHQCDRTLIYRLLVDGLEASTSPFRVIRDVTWTAITWENG
ncbi:hypothetical protein ACFSCZ_14380 [Siminovitchia sediminis]|uniref:Uncharacterized protein n=1 Tax=Siminovitchia sediminis TaxID=1274353 RepID=A0ABW4KIE1_9BACI